MGERTDSDRKPLPTNGHLKWILAVAGALGLGGGGGALAILRGDSDPKVLALEEKIEEQKEERLEGIEIDIGGIKKEQSRQGRLLSRIAGKLKVHDPDAEEEEP